MERNNGSLRKILEAQKFKNKEDYLQELVRHAKMLINWRGINDDENEDSFENNDPLSPQPKLGKVLDPIPIVTVDEEVMMIDDSDAPSLSQKETINEIDPLNDNVETEKKGTAAQNIDAAINANNAINTPQKHKKFSNLGMPKMYIHQS